MNSKHGLFKTGLVIAAALLILLGAGCAGRVANVHHASGYDPLARDGAKYAIAGFVLRAQSELDEQSGIGTKGENADPRYQTDTWAPVLYGSMLTAREGLEVWAWSAVRENIPADAITAVQENYARGSILRPLMFTALARDLPDITYLVLARIDRNDIEIESLSGLETGNQIVDESRNPHAATNGMLRTVKTRRKILLHMDVFDLRSGYSVWSSSVEREKTELFGPSEAGLKDEFELTPAVEEGGLPEIKITGASLDTPLLVDLLEDACQVLVADLFAQP